MQIQPDLYYEFLKDLPEDYFIWAITKICREQVELYPNTNIVALIRSHEDQFKFEKVRRKPEPQIEHKEPDYDSEETKKAVEDFRKMRDKIAGKKDANLGTDKRNSA